MSKILSVYVVIDHDANSYPILGVFSTYKLARIFTINWFKEMDILDESKYPPTNKTEEWFGIGTSIQKIELQTE